MQRLSCLALLASMPFGGSEPEPRTPRPLPLTISGPVAHVSAAAELPDGRVIITNAAEPSVQILDPSSGTLTPLGAAGGGPDRYAKPGGLYPGPDGSLLLLDRGQTRAFMISSGGRLQGSRAIGRRGVTSTSDRDVDLQRLDATGLVYFIETRRLGVAAAADPSASLVRFDPAAQAAMPVARLRLPDGRTTAGGDGLTITRTILGSPADGWGVAPDGRVAVVRADPYRVEWHAPDGRVRRGPAVAYEPLPITEAEKRRYAAAVSGGASVSRTGQAAADIGSLGLLFAETLPPFEPDGILVSPDARVWVRRTRPAGASGVVYDVFDSSAVRIDRLAFPSNSAVVGFGPGAVYVRVDGTPGRSALRKYSVKP